MIDQKGDDLLFTGDEDCGSTTDASEPVRFSDIDESADSDKTCTPKSALLKKHRSRNDSTLRNKYYGVGKMPKVRYRWTSTLLSTSVYGCLHGSVDQLLPASFKALETDLELGPTALGAASSALRMAIAIVCPFWGVLVDKSPRKRIFVVTSMLWGVAAVVLGLSTCLWQMVASGVFLGAFLGALGPLSQKVIAEELPPGARGKGFGGLHFFQSIGRVCALMVTINLTGYSLAGARGWRWVFLFWGTISIVMAMILNNTVTNVPERKEGERSGKWMTREDLHNLIKNKSFWILLVVGVLNGIPRSALSFITMWFQYCGLSDIKASFVVSASWFAAIFVAPAVGYVGDWFYSISPNHGRQMIAQVSLFLRAALMTILLWLVPKKSSSYGTFLVLSILIGLLAGWPGVGVNRPILTEIVKAEHRATVFSLVTSCEGVGAALFGAPIVGVLADNLFGYSKLSRGKHTDEVEDIVRDENATALSYALLCTTVVPWIFLIFVYFALHLTYQFDKKDENNKHMNATDEDSRKNGQDRGEHGPSLSNLRTNGPGIYFLCSGKVEERSALLGGEICDDHPSEAMKENIEEPPKHSIAVAVDSTLEPDISKLQAP